MEEELQIRTYRAARGGKAVPEIPTLIYLPGLQGDWTLVGGFRQAIAQRAHFVEMTYPRSLTWSLDDYAAAIETGLEGAGIHTGWLLAESFGSQIGWQLLGRGKFHAKGLILAGGFVRHPAMCEVRLAALLLRSIPARLMKLLLRIYEGIFRLRYRRSPDVLSEMRTFIERRTELDIRAAAHRLSLIASNSPCSTAQECRLPVYSLTGFFDPIVPWVPVRRWLSRSCPGLRGQSIIWKADHTVLATAPIASAERILSWTA